MAKPRVADRIEQLPPYLFAVLDQLKQQALDRGADLINLGVGDPDLPTPQPILARLHQASQDPKNHQYPSYEGLLSFRKAVASWYARRFGVRLDPKKEVITLIGSKEGIGHFPLAFINPRDVALIPDPGYPVYDAATLFAGGQSYLMSLKNTHGYLPRLDQIPSSIIKKAKLLFLNYPNNPTSATATHAFFEEVVSFAKNHNIVVCHDAAYSEIYFDGSKPISFMEVRGAKDVGIEFNSLSKTYNMTGWRIGFAVGNPLLIEALGKVKSNIDSGVFQAVQEAGITALELDEGTLMKMRQVYEERRDVLVTGLLGMGLELEPPKASFYVWARVPNNKKSSAFCAELLEKTGIVTTPGDGFGKSGEGFFRMALTVSKERLQQAIGRMEPLIRAS